MLAVMNCAFRTQQTAAAAASTSTDSASAQQKTLPLDLASLHTLAQVTHTDSSVCAIYCVVNIVAIHLEHMLLNSAAHANLANAVIFSIPL
jgi:hypothetical protein